MLASLRCCCGPSEDELAVSFDVIDERVGSTNTTMTSGYPEELSPSNGDIPHEQGMATLLRRPPMLSAVQEEKMSAKTSTATHVVATAPYAPPSIAPVATLPKPPPLMAHFSPLEPLEDSKGRVEELGLILSQFRQQAAVGRSCVVLVQDAMDTLRPAGRRLATYTITPDRYLLVSFGPGHEPFSCSVDNIQDVYQLMDGEDCFPRNIIAALNKQELNHLLMVVFYPHGPRGSEDVRETFCFLETTPTGRDLLLELLKEVALAQ
mmetsp:Transcript_51822/g.110093  ORF Transcript_51822/g.110093 Transcript_51822/m.110093 type:complete len:264 (+) Transcript_51822:176-967(+)